VKVDPTEQKIIDRLTRSINLAYNSPGRMFWYAVLWGLGRGLGATLGLGLMVAAAVYLFRVSGMDNTFKSIMESLEEISHSLNSQQK